MDLNESLAFVTVVKSGSFTAAGKLLGAPKATISRRVARLETRLSTRLLERTTRRIGLTASGRVYYERCGHAIEAIENAERATREATGAVAGTLRVSAPFDFVRDRLAAWLPALRARHPQLELVLELGQRRVDLVAEGFDVALRAGPSLDDSSLVARKLAPSELVLVASPTYLAKRGTPARIDDLAKHDLMALGSRESPARRRLDGPHGPVDVPFRAWLVTNEIGTLRAAAIDHLGIALIEARSVAKQLAAKRLRRVLPSYNLGGAALWAVYPSSHYLAPKVRAFIDFVVEKLADD